MAGHQAGLRRPPHDPAEVLSQPCVALEVGQKRVDIRVIFLGEEFGPLPLELGVDGVKDHQEHLERRDTRFVQYSHGGVSRIRFGVSDGMDSVYEKRVDGWLYLGLCLGCELHGLERTD